jgi:adenosine kinase
MAMPIMQVLFTASCTGKDWGTTGRIASLLGVIKIEQHGTQNHSFTAEEFADRYLASFGDQF